MNIWYLLVGLLLGMWFVRQEIRLRGLQREIRRLGHAADIHQAEWQLLQSAVTYFAARDQILELSADESLRDQEAYTTMLSNHGQAPEFTPTVKMMQSQREVVRMLEWMRNKGMDTRIMREVGRAVIR